MLARRGISTQLPLYYQEIHIYNELGLAGFYTI
jgi:hypothetical protein